MSTQQRENRLAKETSPYLLQHARNPVDWHPWDEEALRLAKELDRPIFLSVGYSACHWCHVMERESFEDEEIAARMNRWFVNVKVDREERPDVDEIYMKAVQAMTGQGGWPMSVFLTPELEPFFGGTYFPPDARYGRPGFGQLLAWVAELWEKDRERVLRQGRSMAEAIAQEGQVDLGAEPAKDVLDRSLASLVGSFDPRWGGFGGAPKFPHSVDLRLSLRHWLRTGSQRALDAATVSLRRMAEGGIYDHLGGGFARYSTDEKWLVPHFEKMLYDNALLVPAYLEAFLATGEPSFARVARETCEWMLRDMRTPEGGLASALDADSEGEEGKFYVWTRAELEEVLGSERGARAAEWFGVTDEGNFEHGRSVLWRHVPAAEVAQRLGLELAALEQEMEEARAALLAARERRVPPGKDDKVLASWNGLAVSALAQAHQVLGEPRFLDAARGVARFVLGMRTADGRLQATYRAGRAHLAGYLDDHAFLIQGLLDLYESDFDEAWLRAAVELEETLAERFEDGERGGFFTVADDHERLIARLKSPHDGALPSGNGVQALNLVRMEELLGDPSYGERARRTIRSVGALMNRHPAVFSQMLLAVDVLEARPREIVVAGLPGSPEVARMLEVVRGTFLPQRVVALSRPGSDLRLLPLLADKQAPAGQALAYVCRDRTCGLPARSPEELRRQLA